MSATTDQKRAALEIVKAMADTIRSLGRVPSGELYARVMGHLDLRTYERVIDLLKSSGLVKEIAHELIWIGPQQHTAERTSS